jgi:hypothetical protein
MASGDVTTPLGNRDHAAGEKRERRGALRYTDREWMVITAVAVREGKRPGAWAQQAAYDAAWYTLHGQPGYREQTVRVIEQLRQLRNVLANIGGNVNDLAKAANSTGEIETVQVLGRTLRIVRRVAADAAATLNDVRAGLLPR